LFLVNLDLHITHIYQTTFRILHSSFLTFAVLVVNTADVIQLFKNEVAGAGDWFVVSVEMTPAFL
jgi:hypothetical protein